MNMPARYPERIVGISGYTVRPSQARRDKPKVSAFLSAKTDKILTLEPDLVIGFSDLQADIARDSRRCRSRPAIDGMPEDRLSIFHIKRDATATDLLLDRGEIVPDLLDELIGVDHVGLRRAGGSRRAPFRDLGARGVAALGRQRG